ncbi:MAG: TetR/AcrR family transcriptional regulator [Acidimicrobiia bacterium]
MAATQRTRQSGPGRPPAGDSEKTRQAILGAAEQAFGEHGYRGASIERIGALAGVATSVLYHYARNKAELFAMAIRSAADDLGSKYGTVLEREGFDARIDGLFDLMLWMYRHESARMFFIASRRQEMARHPELRDALGTTWRFTGPLIERIVRDAADSGELSGQTSPEAMCAALRVLLDGIAHAAAAREPYDHYAAHVATAADLFRAYRAPRPGRARRTA